MAHPLFTEMQMTSLNSANFDEHLAAHRQELVGVFFWGHDCPNCEVAKKILYQDRDIFKSFGLTWFQVNTYEDFDLATRFGLHGIPTFLFFYQDKKLGKISPFPGSQPFFQALKELRTKYP